MVPKLTNEGLRKAAVLVASLDTDAADAVLDQLTPEQARQVREIVVEMDDVDQGEQRRVIDEFRGQGAESNERGVEWMPSAHYSVLPAPSSPLPAPSSQPPPFHFLQQTEADQLVRVLGNERPQTIALVLAHLPPVCAGAVLARLPEVVQVDVIQRLVDLEETDPAILREVEEALQARLSSPASGCAVEMQRRRVAGLHAVAGILHATDGRVGMHILDNLASRDRALAEKLGPRPMAFDDLADLDDDLLAEIFDEAGPQLMLPALFGAAPDVVGRVLAQLPHADAQAVRHKLDHPDPIRLRDVEEARRQVARIASRLNYLTRQNMERAA